MMFFQRKIACALVAGLGLMAGGMVHADSETGNVKLTTAATGAYASEVVLVAFDDADPLKSGRCTGSGTMILPLAGIGSESVYKALLAANINSKTVTIEYGIDESDNCEVYLATLN